MIAALAIALVAAGPALLPGAEGKLCLGCHQDLTATLQKPFVHTPLQQGNCTGCHDPHASQHEKLLGAEPKRICLSCHQGVLPAGAVSVHQPVAQGACTSCHDPHASAQKFELVKPAGQLCASCHQALADGAFRARFKHGKTSSCTDCHDAHAAANATLLRTAEPALCLKCHAPGKKLLGQHQGYQVSASRCTSCHDPHGSSKRGMLFDDVHAPVAARTCGDCHAGPGTPSPLALKKEGMALCQGCHRDEVAKILSRTNVHQAAIGGQSCLSCHTPHASPQRALLAGPQKMICATCHAESLARAARSPTQHDPVRDGNCTACHDPHSSDTPMLLRKANDPELCGTCHDWQKHSSHPIGEKLRDPRNPNLAVTCLSCHRAHGTEYKHLDPYPSTTELCTKCHEQFKR